MGPAQWRYTIFPMPRLMHHSQLFTFLDHLLGVRVGRNGRIEARIWFDGKEHSLGSYRTSEEAARAYDR